MMFSEKKSKDSLFLKIILPLMCLTSCQLEPRYEPPLVAASAEWKNQPSLSAEAPQVDNWWEVFNDPALNELEELAVAQNYNLAAAAERVIQARDQANIIRSRLYPQLDLYPVYKNQDVLYKLFGLNNSSSTTGHQSGASSSQKSIIREHRLLYALPLNLSYELDLWGKIRGQYQSAVLEAMAQDQAFYEMQLLLTADLAIAYFELRTQDTLIDLLNGVIQTRKKALEITQSLYEGRIIDFSAVAMAELELSNAVYQYEDAIRTRALYENQMAVLIGVPASEFAIAPAQLSQAPPQIPAGVPSEILLQRPDLAEQELVMASIHKQIGVAYASFFPSVQLSAGIGFSSPVKHDFLSWKSRYVQFGTDVSQYVFDAGAREYNVKMTWAEFREAADAYQQRVLVAFEEVENALSNLGMLAKEMGSVQESVNAAHKANTLAAERYRDGVTNYLEVVDTERQELQNQEILTHLLGMRYLNTVQLIKALGGTWKSETDCLEGCS